MTALMKSQNTSTECSSSAWRCVTSILVRLSGLGSHGMLVTCDDMPTTRYSALANDSVSRCSYDQSRRLRLRRPGHAASGATAVEQTLPRLPCSGSTSTQHDQPSSIMYALCHGRNSMHSSLLRCRSEARCCLVLLSPNVSARSPNAIEHACLAHAQDT